MATRSFWRAVQENLNVGVGTAVVGSPSGGSRTGTQIGIHSLAVGQGHTTKAWTPGAVAAGSKVSTTVTVAGAALGDFVLRSFSLDLQELQLTADVVAADTVEAVITNLTGAEVTLGAGTLAVLVLKSRSA